MTVAEIEIPEQNKKSRKKDKKSTPKNGQEREEQFEKLIPVLEGEKVDLPFHVLGYTPERKILIWHEKHLMSFSVSQLRIDEVSLLIEFNEPEEGFKKIKNEIINEARKKGIIDETDPIKMGIWLINSKWLIVSGKTALEIVEGKITEIEHPVYNSKIIHFGKSWLNTKKFKDGYGKSSLSFVYNKLYKYISQWCWKEKDAAKYLSALVMVIAFQQAMKWRPWVYLSGETGTGKSLFLEEVIGLLFGDLIKRADKTTEHAVYQSVGNTSKILCLDEFEKSRHLPQVMEALKLMNRGGEKTTGTPGEKELIHLLHHIPILASIYTPSTCIKDESQRNRLMQFELTKPKDRRPPTIWNDDEAEDILAELVAAMIENWIIIQEKADQIVSKTDQIKQKMDGQIDDRTVHNFMYVSAILELVTGEEHTVPTWSKIEKRSDGQSIIETIIFCKVKHENKDYFVVDLIDAAMRRPSPNEISADAAKNTLRLHGLTIVERETWFLAIRAEHAPKHLFKGDEYKNMDISLPLQRITGAEKKCASFGGGSSLSSIQVPMSIIDELRGYQCLN